MVDTAELVCVYGGIQNPLDCPEKSTPDSAELASETQVPIQTYEKQFQAYQVQLEKAEAREQVANAEKLRLLDLADRLQKQNKKLMLSPPQKSEFWESSKKVFTPA